MGMDAIGISLVEDDDTAWVQEDKDTVGPVKVNKALKAGQLASLGRKTLPTGRIVDEYIASYERRETRVYLRPADGKNIGDAAQIGRRQNGGMNFPVTLWR